MRSATMDEGRSYDGRPFCSRHAIQLSPWLSGIGQKQSGCPSMWGVACAATPAIAAGSFLVGDLQTAVTLYERLAPEFSLSSEHLDHYARNLLLARLEERVALAIREPGALVAGTFGAITD
jgi:hypothetical protein